MRKIIVLLSAWLIMHAGLFNCLFAQTTIAEWNFDDQDVVVDDGAGAWVSSKLAYEDFVERGVAYAVSYGSWGSDLNLDADFVEISISSQSLYGLDMSLDCCRTATGPQRLRVLASKDNFSTWIQLSDELLENEDAWYAFTDVAVPGTFNNQPSVQFRIYGYESEHWTGRMRLDNIVIHGTTEQSLPVECTYFSATQSRDQIIIAWKTESEVDVKGFHLLRSENEKGDYIYISNHLIPSEGNGSSVHCYEFIDTHVEPETSYWYQVEVCDNQGNSQMIGPVLSRVEKDKKKYSDFLLLPSFPNPFNPSTTIHYYLPEMMRNHPIVLKIYNLMGREVVTLYRGVPQVGLQQLYWNGCDANGFQVADGPYFVYLQADNFNVRTQKILKIK